MLLFGVFDTVIEMQSLLSFFFVIDQSDRLIAEYFSFQIAALHSRIRKPVLTSLLRRQNYQNQLCIKDSWLPLAMTYLNTYVV
jgi:hypothetical protein